MVEFGKKLTKKDADGKVSQWGVRIPSSGFPYWLFQGFAIENGATLANAEGNETNFDDPKVVEALQIFGRPEHQTRSDGTGHHRVGRNTKGFL